MTNINLKAYSRPKNFKRTASKIPAIIYGPKTKNQAITISYADFDKLYKTSGESTLIDLEVDKQKPFKALIHQIQYDPLTDKYLHVDFYQLDMSKKLKVEIDIAFQGVEEIEKVTGGEAIKNLDKIEVECSPENLIREIELDVRKQLKKIGDVIYSKDIKLTEGLSLITGEDIPVISLKEIRESITESPAESETEEKAKETTTTDNKEKTAGKNDDQTEEKNQPTEDKK